MTRAKLAKINSKGRLGAYLNTVIADLQIETKGQYFRDLFKKYDKELADHVEKLLEECDRKARIEELKKCRLAILRSWGMNYSKQRIAELEKAKGE